MKNSSLYQQLKAAKKDHRIVNTRVLAMEKEFEEATETIKEKYKPILIELEKEAYEKSQKFWDLADIYKDYGRFFICDIVNIFSVLLSYVEGEKYIRYEHFENSEIDESSVIIKEKVNKQYDSINYDTLDRLYKNGDLIMLSRGMSGMMVEFYDYLGEPNYSFGQFNYLREFVNRLIQYRIDNGKKNMKDITMEDLYSFMCNFISTHPELAKKNKDKREQMLIGQSEDEPLISKCKKIERKLKII